MVRKTIKFDKWEQLQKHSGIVSLMFIKVFVPFSYFDVIELAETRVADPGVLVESGFVL